MRIFSLIGRNARRGPVTLRLPERHAPPPGFRGMVRIDAGRCLGCGTCDYVCVSGAIMVTDHGDRCVWEHEPGRCTFCGRCVDTCPGEALSQESDRAPVHATLGELRETVEVAYPKCPNCGRPARPLGEKLGARAFAGLGDDLRTRTLLCERCRLRRSQSVLKAGLRPAVDPEGAHRGP